MSEYQYYEFRTIDRQLTAAQRTNVNNLSSHGHTTATSFSVDYSWGDFKHEPNTVLARYFDAFFYMANWGSAILKFRFPKSLVDPQVWTPYCIEESMTINHTTIGDSVILSFEYHPDDGADWIETEGMLDGLIGLYEEILQGDHRVLYLAWLGVIQYGAEYSNEFDDDTLEPPVPAGLDKLSAAQNDFVDLFGVEKELIAAAAKGSESQPLATKADEMAALAALPKEECIDFLRRLLQGEAHIELKLKQRLGLLQPAAGDASSGLRTVGSLLAERDEVENIRKRAAAVAKEEKRQAAMQALADRGDSAWQEVDALIGQKTAIAYKEAGTLLMKLGELARERGDVRAFTSRVAQIRSQYSRRSALMRELNRFQV